jgi:hypothetical protein
MLREACLPLAATKDRRRLRSDGLVDEDRYSRRSFDSRHVSFPDGVVHAVDQISAEVCMRLLGQAEAVSFGPVRRLSPCRKTLRNWILQ